MVDVEVMVILLKVNQSILLVNGHKVLMASSGGYYILARGITNVFVSIYRDQACFKILKLRNSSESSGPPVC